MIPTDLQISNDEVQLIVSRFYHRNVFQMPFWKNGVMTGSQYVIFTENSDFTLSNDPRLISNFFYNKGSVVHISIYPRTIIWGVI